jgi:hypothetical protein
VEEIKAAILVPTRDVIPSWFAYSLGLAMGHLGKNYPEVDATLYFNNGTLLAEQRSALAKLALKDGASWLIWLDSDMRFPSDTFPRLMGHKVPIVGAGYPTRKMPAIEPTAYTDYECQDRIYTEDDSTGLVPVSAMGFGCICVHREVYEAMPPPWFHIPWDAEKMKHDCGEDIYFCRKAKENGFEVMLDHDLSKEVFHIGNAEYGYKEALAARPYIKELRRNMIERAITR